ncbi:MAG: hypothetical protein HN404_22600 [Gemmatimonadetes bacterium]|nr:hypothetical protein [Gemmatimonadota bacterium]
MQSVYLPIHMTDTSVESEFSHISNRQPGELLCKGGLKLGRGQCIFDLPAAAPESARQIAARYEEGFRFFAEGFADHPALRGARKDMGTGVVQVEFTTHSDRVLRLHPPARKAGKDRLVVDSSWGQEGPSEAARIFSGLMLLGTLSMRAGRADQRVAMYRVFDLYTALPPDQKELLQAFLRSSSVDCGHVFANAFRCIHDVSLAQEQDNVDITILAEVPTETLFAAGHTLDRVRYDEKGPALRKAVVQLFREIPGAKHLTQPLAGESADEFAGRILWLVEKTLKWRDKWATWMRMQDRVDFPYPQDHAIELLDKEFDDLDEKRSTVNQLVSKFYDFDTEGENIRRITEWASENDIRLVSGRLSRAFGNQANLLATARYIRDKEPLVRLASRMEKECRDYPELHTAATRILHLVQEQKRTSYARIAGAINAFDQTLVRYQAKAARKILEETDQASRLLLSQSAVKLSRQRIGHEASLTDRLLGLSAQFRQQLDGCPKDPAAYVLQLQRLHPGESINLANANAFREVHSGKEEDLLDLLRQGGDYIYSAPGPGRIKENGKVVDSHWIIEVHDWIEAIPLFIKERVIHRHVEVGGEMVDVESIETEVDQEAMEAFFRIHSGYWASNLEAVMASERIGLARQLLVEDDVRLARATARSLEQNPALGRDEAARQALEGREDLVESIAQLSCLIQVSEDRLVEDIHRLVEKDALPRREALQQVLCESAASQRGNLVGQALKGGSLSKAIPALFGKLPAKIRKSCESYAALALRRTRPVSSLHVLTTESAGMTEGYVQTWIEEEMALNNVVRAHGLETEVREQVGVYRSCLYEVGRRVIDDLAMGVVVDEVMADERFSPQLAVGTVVGSYRPVAEQVGILGTLLEAGDDPAATLETVPIRDLERVERYLKDRRADLEPLAVDEVAANNGHAFEQRVEAVLQQRPGIAADQARRTVIDSEQDYREELESILRCRARVAVLDELALEQPGLKLHDRARTFVRTHSQLSTSTARKAVIARHRLNAETMNPRYYYQAAGGNKRYNLLYTPSRVNLGHRERDSVVVWNQWVGAADAAAAQAGFEFYSLVNEGGVEERPALAYAEIQKTAENGLTVNHFAGSNALGLLCMAVLEGDVQDMGDQMNLREDRYIPPAGEGYGGYCVPKDGLFLAFVLSLTNDVKLRQIGVPDHLHESIMRLARRALAKKGDYETELDWQQWAAEKLLKYDVLAEHIDVRGEQIVFHITKIARALENLGRPWYATASGDRLVANLAADWGVQKMIVHAEQVNRFMVFYKAWCIYDALRVARLKHAACPADHQARINVSAEYKPVQDVRFSTGLRLFEIFAQTGDHLHYAMDEEGQNLIHLMFDGFDPECDDAVGRRAARQVLQTYGVSEDDAESMTRLREAFPGHPTPADVVVTSVTQSSTNDMLSYTSDSRLDEIANQVQVKVSDYGLTEDQIRANCEVYGGDLRRWAGISHLPEERIQSLLERVGGGIHALVLKLRGPGRDYERDVQGVDVLNTGIPFKQLLALVQDPPKLIALMLQGNPNSALVIADGCAGREPRALTEYDIQAFFAACERFGRQGTYVGIGLGQRNVDRLEEDMRQRRARAQRVLDAVVAVAQSGAKSRKAAIVTALDVYGTIQRGIIDKDDAGKALRVEQRARRYNKWTQRDAYISQALVKLASGLPLSRLDQGTWLAGLGGSLALLGEAPARVDALLADFDAGIALIAKAAKKGLSSHAVSFTADQISGIREVLLRPAFEPDPARFTQQKLVESSSKAVEIAAVEALERRQALRVRAEKARAMSDRESGFRDTIQKEARLGPAACDERARDLLEQLLVRVRGFDVTAANVAADRTAVHELFGRLIGYTRLSLDGLANELMAGQPARLSVFRESTARIFGGREIVLEDWKLLAGGYEDMGDLARLADLAAANPAKLDLVARSMELFYTCFALGQTLQFSIDDPDEIDPRVFYKSLTDFFAETINDHWHGYTPWCFYRGSAFSDLSPEQLFELSVERHEWLYRYIRTVIVSCTDLRILPVAEVDALLGQIDGDRVEVGIGAGGEPGAELRWRAYNQLREISFMHSDGFSTPPIFTEFDPDLIEADRRVNVVFLYPVGRTHVSRALREAPSLNAQLKAQGSRGANLIITRHGEVTQFAGASRQQLGILDGHLYIDRETYIAALQRHRGMPAEAAEAQARAEEQGGRLTAKGIRIAARFVTDGQPVAVQVASLIPFHGLPIYDSGRTEELGLPATVQSRVFSDITYDKSLYPEIFTPSTKVNMPPEIDWKREYGDGLSESATKALIADGVPDTPYSGLSAFAADNAIVLIKGAAESGARNLKVFDLQDAAGRIDQEGLTGAVDFLYDVSRQQSVVVQTAILTSPEFWASPDLMERFVERQILEWNTPVTRDRLPRSQIYGSLRIIATSAHPDQPYEMAFPIFLSSLQVATNIGRGGTLEKLLDEFVREEYRDEIRPGLERDASRVMAAMARYAARYEPEFKRARGREIGQDARGVSYAWPPYLMLDFLVSPVFAHPGRLVDIEPVFDETGRRTGSVPIVQDEAGRHESTIKSWKFIHLEPNVGIGLWDRFNLREEMLENAASEEAGRVFDWNNVGTSDRIVLRNFVIAGEQYLDALHG